VVHFLLNRFGFALGAKCKPRRHDRRGYARVDDKRRAARWPVKDSASLVKLASLPQSSRFCGQQAGFQNANGLRRTRDLEMLD
jgi:hypothetical protein